MHNELYWSMGEYVAIGCAGHGHTDGRRWWNVRTPERYIDAIAAGISPEASGEMLAVASRAEEAFVLALRTRRGAQISAPAQQVASELEAAGLIRRVSDRITLTRPGRLLASDVTARLVLAGAAADEGLALGTIECQPPAV